MYGKDKSIVGCMCAHVDITERKSLASRLSDQLRISQQLNITLDAQRRALEESNRQLSELALRDSLTGLFNRRHLMNTLDKSCSYAIRHNKPLIILMIDVDHFKNYNDDFGHLAGDEVLKVVAQLITKCLRNEDSVGRYGGEEYLAIMPDASAGGSKLVAERLQSMLHQHAWVEREVSVSIGIASLSEETPTAAILLDLADQALYKAKRAGRNAIVVAHHLDPDVWRAA
jgi:diguanylate cyclase (GGDEF)-like protein